MMSRHKYGAKRTVVDGITFDSQAEARRYRELVLLQMAGEISDLECQPEFEIVPAFTRADGKRIRKAVYRADFRYTTADGQTVIEDVKGKDTATSRLKRKLTEYKYNVVIVIVRM
jgi:hypothetical protein